MQEKISNICLRFGSEYPSLGNPPNGRVPSGRIFRPEPQHMTDIIIIHWLNCIQECDKNLPVRNLI
jgi:hypothetical protein